MLAAILLLLLPVAPARGGGQGDQWPVTHRLHEMLAYHVVNPTGEGFTISLNWLNQWQTMMDTPLLVRVLDPNETEVARYESAGLKTSGAAAWNQHDLEVHAGAPGVYQVILTSSGAIVVFGVSPDLSWGLFAYPELDSVTTDYSAQVYLPPGLMQLPVRVTGSVNYVRLTDADGVVHMNLTGTNPDTIVTLPAGDDRIWTLSCDGNAEFSLSFGGMPIIVCPDQATAQAIHASVDVLADGTICFHKFQQQAHALLATYRAMDPTAFAVAPPNFAQAMAEWMAEPTRNYLLVGPAGVMSALGITLDSQNLDPASPWFGSTRVWLDEKGQERTENPMTAYNRLGLEEIAPLNALMAAAHSADTPVNPLFQDQELRNRIVVAALAEVMMIREHELPMQEYNYYDGGEKAFQFARSMRAYQLAVASCPGDVQVMWTAAQRRMADHMLAACVPDIVNQWSFIIRGLQLFADGCGEQAYRDALARQIDWVTSRRQAAAGHMPAGYFSENNGPDASYAGIHMHNLALVAQTAGSAPLTNALKESYELFSHFVAPEPDGSWLGPSNYCHRRPESWTTPNTGAGVGVMADECAAASVMLGHVWLPDRLPRNPAELANAQQQLQWHMVHVQESAWDDPSTGLPTLRGAPDLQFALWQHFATTPVAPAQLPMKSSTRFTRKFGDEFLCVRKPTYYAFTYAGKNMESWKQANAPADPDAQYPRNGGGLSMLWSPKLGTSILSRNWSAYASNALVARKGSNEFFEDYWQTSASLQSSQSRATINGGLTGGKMTFRRTVSFLEDRIACDIRIQAAQKITYDRLWECFPFPTDKPQAIEVALYDAEGRAIAGDNKIASAIVFRTSASEVHVIAFNQPRRCETQTRQATDNYGATHEFGSVLTQLPPDWNAGQVRTVKWTARVVNNNQVAATIKQMVGAMK